ncbi:MULTISPECIES: sulfite exporter TauE/SafE family protein [unclassified Nocardiopsis]|uniref:sulfite exporter TauE/SafE family protein n=1 Tax=Nocardiopsis TaxID=2013 RepID=UPI00387A8A56
MLTSLLLLLALGCLSGLTTVAFGFGGGFVTVPVVYAFTLARGEPGTDAMAVAVATSTAVMIVNSAVATRAQYRAGRLRREHLWPLAAYIGLGGAAGAWAATLAGGGVQHVLFVAYLVVAIADSLLRKGFLDRPTGEAPRPLGPGATPAVGAGIGAVTGFLGVGGSVMTVPLLRRRGLPMLEATAMANPLSLPVALAGTAVYALLGTGGAGAGQGYAGSVDLVAAGLLLAGSLPAIAVARRHVARVPDRVHAVAFVVLLVLALVAVLLV